MSADKVDIFMPIYIGDYMADTSDLTTEEHGAYFLILMAMWRTREALPLHRLRPIAKVASSRWAPIWEVISRFFDVDTEGLVTQRRLWRELEAALEKKRRASDRGRKGGLARAQAQADSEQGMGTTQAVLAAKPLPSPLPSKDPDPPPFSLPISQPPDRAPARSETRATFGAPERTPMPWDATLAFMACFRRYPNQNGRLDAAGAWQEIIVDYPGGEEALRDAILARFDAGILTRHPYAGPQKYRPTFETFLRKRRWEDADSAPDPVEVEKPVETLQQRDARALREGAERRDAEIAELRRKSREAERAAAEKLRAGGQV